MICTSRPAAANLLDDPLPVASPTPPPRRCPPDAAWPPAGGRRRRCTAADSSSTCSSRGRTCPTGRRGPDRRWRRGPTRSAWAAADAVAGRRRRTTTRCGPDRRRSSCSGSASAPRGVSSSRLSVLLPASALPRSWGRGGPGRWISRRPAVASSGSCRRVVVIVEILVAQRQAENPLPQHAHRRCVRLHSGSR